MLFWRRSTLARCWLSFFCIWWRSGVWLTFYFLSGGGEGGGDSIVWGLNSCQHGLWLMKPWKSRHVGYSDWLRIEIVLVMSLFYLGRCTISLKWLLCLSYCNVGYLVSRLPKKFITLKWNYNTINKVLHDQHFHVGFFGNSHCLCTSCLWEKLPATRIATNKLDAWILFAWSTWESEMNLKTFNMIGIYLRFMLMLGGGVASTRPLNVLCSRDKGDWCPSIYHLTPGHSSLQWGYNVDHNQCKTSILLKEPRCPVRTQLLRDQQLILVIHRPCSNNGANCNHKQNKQTTS